MDVRAAVASLARHVICAPRLVPCTGRHMPRLASRSLGCAVAARRLLPLPCKHVSRSRRPLRYAPGRARSRGCGGAGARCKCWIKGCPILASLFERAEGWLFGRSMSCVIATRHQWLGWVSGSAFGQVSQHQVPVGHEQTKSPRDALGGPLREGHSSVRSRGLAAKKNQTLRVTTQLPPGCGVSVSPSYSSTTR